MNELRVLAFAREAGGASAIAPVVRELAADGDVVLTAKDHGLRVFCDAGFQPLPLEASSLAVLEREVRHHLRGVPPMAVLTSATSLPHLDMTEKYLWEWARTRRIPSVGMLDQWQNYAVRFSGPGPGDRLRYVPDRIAAMDEHARRQLIECGIPGDRVVVTGQPAFDRLVPLRTMYDHAEGARLRDRLGVAPAARLVVFVAEALARDFGRDLGYDEHFVLRETIDACQALGRDDVALHLAIKLHPQNERAEFGWLDSVEVRRLSLTVHGTEEPPLPLVLAGDVVVGMTSVLLVESVLLGRPTMSFQPNARRDDGLIATVVGAIPLLRDRAGFKMTLRRLLCDVAFRADYLERQARLTATGDAARRVAALVKTMVKERR